MYEVGFMSVSRCRYTSQNLDRQTSADRRAGPVQWTRQEHDHITRDHDDDQLRADTHKPGGPCGSRHTSQQLLEVERLTTHETTRARQTTQRTLSASALSGLRGARMLTYLTRVAHARASP